VNEPCRQRRKRTGSGRRARMSAHQDGGVARRCHHPWSLRQHRCPGGGRRPGRHRQVVASLAEQDGVGGGVGDVRNPGLTVAVEDAVADTARPRGHDGAGRPRRGAATSASFNTQLQACSLRRDTSQRPSLIPPAERDACNPLCINRFVCWSLGKERGKDPEALEDLLQQFRRMVEDHDESTRLLPLWQAGGGTVCD
jgi:hypothetical protein